MRIEEGRRRVVIEAVRPEIDAGRHPIKRTIRPNIRVEADVFADGHDEVSRAPLNGKCGEQPWNEAPMRLLVNDRWRQVHEYFM